jgi:DNA adenine methylase
VTAQRPPIKYYGSKVRRAPWIAAILPPRRCYEEPHSGSGAVLFTEPVSTHEIVSNPLARVVNFFKVLRDRPGSWPGHAC